MAIVIILLRLVHIFGGVYWVGASFFVASVISPAVIETGEAGKKFMQHLSVRSKMNPMIAGAATLTFLSGFILYWWLSGFKSGWILSPYGLTLTIGGLAGSLAWMHGLFTHMPYNRKMKALAAEIANAGGPPQPEQVAQMQQLAAKTKRAGIASTIMVSIALIGMSIAQYVSF